MIIKGTIIRILDRGVVVALENDIEGFVPSFQLGEGIKKPADVFKVGDELPLKVIEFDKEQRKIILSVREYFRDRDKAEYEAFREKYKPRPMTIGDKVGDILENAVGRKSAPAEEKARAETPKPAEPGKKTEPAGKPGGEKEEEEAVTGEQPADKAAPAETVAEEEEKAGADESGDEAEKAETKDEGESAPEEKTPAEETAVTDEASGEESGGDVPDTGPEENPDK